MFKKFHILLWRRKDEPRWPESFHPNWKMLSKDSQWFVAE